MQLPLQLSLRKITTGIGIIVFVGALVIGATGAFFSDTETSTGNTFSAGAIDLKIDNQSYVTNADGLLVFSSSTSWGLSDLTDQLFFDFDDLKPGDIGEDTISVHAGSNNAWACMAADLTGTPDNGITEPEGDDGDVTDGPTGGELQNFLNFAFWNDDGDNVFETGETQITPLTGPASTIFDGTWRPIADSSLGASSTIIGNSTRYIGKAWCFGTLTGTPVAQDGSASSTPLTRGTGFTCNGAAVNNVAQTDGISVDVSFQAVQTRSNGQFLCSSLPPLNGTSTPVGTTTLTVTKVIHPGADQTPPATTTFSFAIDGGANIPFEADGTNVVVVSAAAHSVVETVKDSDYVDTYTNSSNANTNCTALNGSNLTCTITNTFSPLQAPIGAALGEFTDSPICDVTATSSINAAIALAAPLQTVCVPDGTFIENVVINKDITLSGSGATSTSIITGNVSMTANGATLQGFQINGNVSGTASGLSILFNKVLPLAGGNGILIGGATGGATSVIANNVVTTQALTSPNNRGIYLDSTGVSTFTVDNNTVTARKSGFGNGSSGTVTDNVFKGYVGATTTWSGFEVFHDAGDVIPTINHNNFDESAGIGLSNLGTLTFNATNNWWGDPSSAGNLNGPVTTSGDQAVAYPENP